MRAFIAILLFLFFSASACLADRSLFFDPVTQVQKAQKNFEENSSKSSDWTIYQNFRTVMSDLKKDDFAAISTSIDQLKFVSVTRGYTDLPDYSIELLRNVALQRDQYKAKFLVERAVFLSPTDSRVAFSASTFHRFIGISKSLSLLFKAVVSVTNQPILFANIVLTLVIVLLVSITISIFLAYFIQMLRNSSLIREAMFSLLPWKFRGILSVLALLLLYVAPFFGGILVVLTVWGMCLGAVLGKRYLYIVGVLCMLWGWSLPVLSKVAFNINDSSSRVFEDLNLSRFSPQAEQYLQDRLAENPNDGTSLFFLGQTFRLKGFSDSASALLTRVDEIVGIDNDLKQISRANLGVIAFDKGDYTRALELLSEAESQGVKGFEIYYNLAIANLVLIKTDEYTKYYNLAKAISPERISQIVTEKYTSPKAILIPVTRNLMLKPLFNPIASANVHEMTTVQSKYREVSRILSRGLSSNVTLVIGFLLCLICFGAKFKKSSVIGASKVWICFPFGRYLASSQTTFGIVGLSFFVSVLMLAPSGPFELYDNYINFDYLYTTLLLAAILGMLFFQCLSFYIINNRPNER